MSCRNSVVTLRDKMQSLVVKTRIQDRWNRFNANRNLIDCSSSDSNYNDKPNNSNEDVLFINAEAEPLPEPDDSNAIPVQRVIVEAKAELPIQLSKTTVFRRPNGSPICFYCRKVGHIVKYCRTKRRHLRRYFYY